MSSVKTSASADHIRYIDDEGTSEQSTNHGEQGEHTRKNSTSSSTNSHNRVKSALHSAKNFAGKAWHKAVETGENMFGAKIVCEPRPRGGRKCTCIILDEIRLSMWILLTLMGMVCAALFIYVSVTQVTWDAIADNKYYIAVIISACFSLAATFVTHQQIKAHHANWTAPKTQGKIVRIVLMVPIYAWSAWIGLIFIEWAPYVDFIRISYEAYVIYNFLLLLTKYLGGHVGVVAVLKSKPEQYAKWPAPMWCCPRAHLGSTFLWAIKRGTIQYVIISPILAFLAVVLDVFHLYGDGEIDWNRGYVYVMIIQNTTQLIALYCLIWLYVIVKEDLQPFSPLAKFLVVKSVVFFTFWQGVGINIAVKIGWITASDRFTAAEVQLGLQDFIICIEMFIAAAVHRYSFGHEMFADGSYDKVVRECRERAMKKGLSEEDLKDSFFDLEMSNPGLENDDDEPLPQPKGHHDSQAPSKTPHEHHDPHHLMPPDAEEEEAKRAAKRATLPNSWKSPLNSPRAMQSDTDQEIPRASFTPAEHGARDKKAHLEFLNKNDT